MVHTGQLYFPEAVSAAVYGRRSPYAARGHKDTSNANDMIYRSGGKQSLLRIAKDDTGYIGRLALGVRM